MAMNASRVAALESPFNCAWIPRGSVERIDDFTYAICTRVPDFPRTVSEADCLRCPFWNEPEARPVHDRA
jgi:hypothetical protein